jgi:ribosomal protein S1
MGDFGLNEILAAQRARDAAWPELQRAANDGRELTATVEQASLDGLVVDIFGGHGIVPRVEMSLVDLLAPPAPGQPWNCHVVSVATTVAVLSSFAPNARKARADARAAELAQLPPGAVRDGLVVGIEHGALVSLRDGLVWGVVASHDVRSADDRVLTADNVFEFRVLQRGDQGDRDVHVYLAPTWETRQAGEQPSSRGTAA